MSTAITELERRKGLAQVGYMAINLYNPPPEATWGMYNDRKINKAWVKSLVTAFGSRCENCTDEDSIEIAIKPEWLKNRAQVRNDVLIESTRWGIELCSRFWIVLTGLGSRMCL